MKTWGVDDKHSRISLHAAFQKENAEFHRSYPQEDWSVHWFLYLIRCNMMVVELAGQQRLGDPLGKTNKPLPIHSSISEEAKLEKLPVKEKHTHRDFYILAFELENFREGCFKLGWNQIALNLPVMGL